MTHPSRDLPTTTAIISREKNHLELKYKKVISLKCELLGLLTNRVYHPYSKEIIPHFECTKTHDNPIELTE